MCEATAYILRDGQEEMVMEGVDILEPEDGQIRMTNMFGEEKRINARIKGFSLLEHKIILEPL
jgi:predicted RNA-binding protein